MKLQNLKAPVETPGANLYFFSKILIKKVTIQMIMWSNTAVLKFQLLKDNDLMRLQIILVKPDRVLISKNKLN